MSDNDFFAPESIDKVFTRNGKTKTFRIHELTGEEAESIFDITGKDGKVDQAKSKGLNGRIIALAVSDVTETGPQAISIDQAKRIPAKLTRDIVQAFMELNSLTGEAAESIDKD